MRRLGYNMITTCDSSTIYVYVINTCEAYACQITNLLQHIRIMLNKNSTVKYDISLHKTKSTAGSGLPNPTHVEGEVGLSRL